MTVAGIIGWILSRLPTRKQKIYIRSTDPIKSEKRLGGGGILRPVLEWKVGNYKAASRRLFHKEDCGNSEVPGRKFYRRCYQMGGCIFKRD